MTTHSNTEQSHPEQSHPEQSHPEQSHPEPIPAEIEAGSDDDKTIVTRLEKTIPIGNGSGNMLSGNDSEADAITELTGDLHSRYQFEHVIGQGGMGVVVRVRDRFLQRQLAMKIISPSQANDEHSHDRFIEEAQIAGQLQHPGIMPVHDIGRLNDQRLFFTMKLVKGQTLSDLLQGRRSLDEQQAKWIGIFEQVCQAVAFAHSKNVIHRDLKPSNVMVGRFGEVQVMDWGLAKVLRQPSGADDAAEHASPPAEVGDAAALATDRLESDVLGDDASDESIVQTIRVPAGDGDDGDESPEDALLEDLRSRVGSVLGTIAYMSPEQALGQNDRLDRRSDVFLLGGIFAEILTGQPPYVAQKNTDRHFMAIRGDLSECFTRIAASAFDDDLKQLARDCLARDPADRPADAGVVAERVAAHLESISERLRNAEIQRAAADARSLEAARTAMAERRRRTAVVLAATLATGLLATIGGAAYWVNRKEADIRVARSEAQVASLQRDREQAVRRQREQRQFDEVLLPAITLANQLQSSKVSPTASEVSNLRKGLQSVEAAMTAMRINDESRQQADAFKQLATHLLAMNDLVSELDAAAWDVSSSRMAAAQATRFKPLLSKYGISSDHDATEIARQIMAYPPWARDEVSVAIEQWRIAALASDGRRASSDQNESDASSQTGDTLGQSVAGLQFLDELTSLLSPSTSDRLLWQAIAEEETTRLIELGNDAEVETWSDPKLIALCEALIEFGPPDYASRLNRQLEWRVLQPTEMVCSLQSISEVLEDGSVRVVSVDKKSETYYVSGLVPAEEIRMIRFETILDDIYPGGGPGQGGTGVNSCLVGDLRFFRQEETGEQRLPLQVTGAIAGHPRVDGREMQRAIDSSGTTHWAIQHRNQEPSLASFISVQEQRDGIRNRRLMCEVHTGDSEVWEPNALGRFRISTSSQSAENIVDPQAVAKELLEKLIARRPASPRVLTKLAQLHAETTPPDLSSAFSFASSALSIAPDDLRSLEQLARIVVSRIPGVDDPWYRRLLGHLSRVDGGAAKQKIVDLICDYYLRQGDLYFESEFYRAIESYQEARRLKPETFARFVNFAKALQRSKRNPEAEAILLEGTQRLPESKAIWQELAIVQRRQGRHAEAYESSRRAVELDPTDVRIQQFFARTSAYVGRCDEAESTLEFLATRDAIDRLTAAYCVVMFVANKDSDKGVRWFQRWSDRELKMEVAESANEAEAAEDADEADQLLLDTDFAWGGFALAMIAAEQGDLFSEQLSAVCQVRPQVIGGLLDALSRMLTGKMVYYFGSNGNPQQWAEIADRIAAIRPDDPTLKLWQALTKLPLGEYADAATIVEQIKDSASDFDATSVPLLFVIDKLCQLQMNPSVKVKISDLPTEAIAQLPEYERDLIEWLWWDFRVNPPSSGQN